MIRAILPPPPRFALGNRGGGLGWGTAGSSDSLVEGETPTTLPTPRSQAAAWGEGAARRIIAVLGAAFVLFVLALPAATRAETTLRASPQQRCQSLAGDRFAHLPGAPTVIVKATFRAAADGKVAACLVEGYVNPADNFAMLLPVDNWNGRYLVRGCGGSCGAVVVELACASHLRDGYACLHADMGHRSTLTDNNWVDNNLQGLVDFGYRATHVTTVAGRAVLRAFYGADARKSYFFACSTGGRQGLIEAQRFPEDFDGIVAIAPASMAPFGNRSNTSTDPP